MDNMVVSGQSYKIDDADGHCKIEKIDIMVM